MNFRLVLRQFGMLLAVLCICMGQTMLWSLAKWMLYDLNAEKMAALSLLVSLAIGLGLACIFWLIGRHTKGDYVGRREAMLLVASSWLVGAAFCALPFYLWAILDPSHPATHEFTHFVDCYFEAMSGLTTTGATVLSDIPSVPQGLLLWRAATHWLGGVGIVVLFVAVLPMLGVGGKKLYQIEAPGPTKSGVRPRIADTARTLWLIYLGLTVAQVLLLRFVGRMTWFESICHTFATLATGGFSTENASIGAFHNRLAVDVITIVFMIFAGINFGLYYQLLRGKFADVWRDSEFRLYLTLILAATALIAVSIYGSTLVLTSGEKVHAGVGESIRQGLFNTVSIQTTTGFCTTDFNLWGFIPKAVLIALMFVGGSAGSTGGGIKVIRILVMAKVLLAEIEKVFRPNVVRTIRVGGAVIDPQLRLSVIGYVLGIILLSMAGAVMLMLLEPQGSISFTTASTAAIATLNNIGPGLEQVGAIENYGHFTIASKVVMSLLMALGRLEVFAILVLFLPSFWRGD